MGGKEPGEVGDTADGRCRAGGEALGESAFDGQDVRYGWRWDAHHTWTRLTAGDTDPVTGRVYTGPSPDAVLRAGDLLLVDEAGMLDQDTALALLTLADQHHARVVLMGNWRQLAAAGGLPTTSKKISNPTR